jgi:hypothetical protein
VQPAKHRFRGDLSVCLPREGPCLGAWNYLAQRVVRSPENNVEDLPVREPDDEEDVKRLEQDRRDTEKVASPHIRRMPVRNSRHVPVGPRRRHPRIYLATVLEET